MFENWHKLRCCSNCNFIWTSRKSKSFLGKKIFLTSLDSFPLAGSLCKSEKDDDKSKIHRSVLSRPKFSFEYIPTLLNCKQPFETAWPTMVMIPQHCKSLFARSKFHPLSFPWLLRIHSSFPDAFLATVFLSYVYIVLIPYNQSFVICQWTYHATG